MYGFIEESYKNEDVTKQPAFRFYNDENKYLDIGFGEECRKSGPKSGSFFDRERSEKYAKSGIDWDSQKKQFKAVEIFDDVKIPPYFFISSNLSNLKFIRFHKDSRLARDNFLPVFGGYSTNWEPFTGQKKIEGVNFLFPCDMTEDLLYKGGSEIFGLVFNYYSLPGFVIEMKDDFEFNENSPVVNFLASLNNYFKGVQHKDYGPLNLKFVSPDGKEIESSEKVDRLKSLAFNKLEEPRGVESNHKNESNFNKVFSIVSKIGYAFASLASIVTRPLVKLFNITVSAFKFLARASNFMNSRSNDNKQEIELDCSNNLNQEISPRKSVGIWIDNANSKLLNNNEDKNMANKQQLVI